MIKRKTADLTKQKYITISDDEANMIFDKESAMNEIDARLDDLLVGCGDEFTIGSIEMTDEEFENLPEL